MPIKQLGQQKLSCQTRCRVSKLIPSRLIQVKSLVSILLDFESGGPNKCFLSDILVFLVGVISVGGQYKKISAEIDSGDVLATELCFYLTCICK